MLFVLITVFSFRFSPSYFTVSCLHLFWFCLKFVDFMSILYIKYYGTLVFTAVKSFTFILLLMLNTFKSLGMISEGDLYNIVVIYCCKWYFNKCLLLFWSPEQSYVLEQENLFGNLWFNVVIKWYFDKCLLLFCSLELSYAWFIGC